MPPNKFDLTRKAAKLAVYDATMIIAKKNHMPPKSRVEMAIGATSQPCWRNVPIVNQNELAMENWFSNSSGSSMQGNGLFHSCGQNWAKM